MGEFAAVGHTLGYAKSQRGWISLKNKRIVHVIDADKGLSDALGSLLAIYGIHVARYADDETFLNTFQADEVSHCCLLVRLSQKESGDISVLRRLRECGSDMPVIVLADSASRETRRQIIRAGATDVIDKPIVNAYLADRLSRLFSPGAGPVDASIKLANGKAITIRAMRPEDAEIEQEFVRGLSSRSKYLRFFSGIKQLSPRMLYQLTHTEFPESYAVIATVEVAGQEQEIAVARYAPAGEVGVAEFAVVVADEWQGHGIASHLLGAVTTAAAIAGIRRLDGLVLKENLEMLALARSLGFTVSDHGDMSAVRVSKALRRSDVPYGPSNDPGNDKAAGSAQVSTDP